MELRPGQQIDIDRELARCSEALIEAGKLDPTSLWATKPKKAEWTRQHADELRVAGNESYKVGALHDAIRFYENAVKVATVIQNESLLPTYLSNLSAAYYESGDYEKALDVIDKAFDRLGSQSDEDRIDVSLPLDIKLRLRECRCLLQIQEFEQLLDAVQDIDQAVYDEHIEFGIVEDAALHALDQQAAWDQDRARNYITCLPRYKPCMREENTIQHSSPVGHDIATSVLTVLTATKADQEASHPDSRILLSTLQPHQLQLAFFIGGCGDPRHVLATLIDVYQQKPDTNMNFELKMALVDRDPVVIARNVLICFILDSLATKNLDKRNSDVVELLALLHYTYLGAIMPNWLHEILLGFIRIVSTKLCSGLGIPKWMNISLDSIDKIIPVYKFWIRGASDVIRIVDWMKLQRPLDGQEGQEDIFSHPNVSPELKQRLKDSREQARVDIKDAIFNFSDSQLNTILMNRCDNIKKITLKAKKELAFELFATDEALDTLTRKRYVPDGLLMEYSTFYQGSLKMLYGPDELHYRDPKLANHLKNLWSSWGAAKKTKEQATDSDRSSSLQAVRDHIQSQWNVNVTLMPGHKAEHRKQLPYEVSFDPFAASQQLVTATGVRPLVKPFRTYDYTAAFFLNAARSIKAYGSKFLFEWMVDESHHVLDKITRSPEDSNFDFFDRIYFASPPDDTGGLLPQIVDSMGCLKATYHAFVASKTPNNALHFSSVDGLFAEYLGLCTPAEARQFLGVGLYGPYPEEFYLADYIRLRPVDPANVATISFASKDYKDGTPISKSRFLDWLYAMFFKIAIPNKLPPDGQSRLPHPLNLHSFFRLLLYLQQIDFPAHWIGGVVDELIQNKVITRSRPITHSPQSMEDPKAEKNVAKPVCVTPFSIEMEAALAMWFPLLTFGITAVVFPDAFNVREYKIKLNTNTEMCTHDQTLPVLSLWFSTNSIRRITVDLARDIVGSHNAVQNVRILSTFEWNFQKKQAKFMCNLSAMDLMRIQNFTVRLIRTDTMETVSSIVPVNQCILASASLADWQEP